VIALCRSAGCVSHDPSFDRGTASGACRCTGMPAPSFHAPAAECLHCPATPSAGGEWCHGPIDQFLERWFHRCFPVVPFDLSRVPCHNPLWPRGQHARIEDQIIAPTVGERLPCNSVTCLAACRSEQMYALSIVELRIAIRKSRLRVLSDGLLTPCDPVWPSFCASRSIGSAPLRSRSCT
jgi:hypothetical protein